MPAVPAPPDGPPVTLIPRPRRRRGRTTLILACAALLGLLAGTGTGYGIQAHRPADPPPALGRRGMNRPAYAGSGAPVTFGTADDLTATGGDLSELLLPIPKGTTRDPGKFDVGMWWGVGDMARTYDDPDDTFGRLLNEHYRRQADALWHNHPWNADGEIDLIQFRDDGADNAGTYLDDEQEADRYDKSGDPVARPVPGVMGGISYLSHPAHPKAGVWRYQGRALARHGDIIVYVFLDSDSHPVSRKAVESLLKRQLERL